MAKQSLAGQWLQENGHTWSGKRPRAATPIRVKKRPSPIFYCEHDRLAFVAQRQRENATLSRKRPETAHLRVVGVDFVLGNVGFDKHECLLMPHAKIGQPATVFYESKGEIAARLMCRLAHGEPSDIPPMVARHLCGNGHLSCVNPTHLCWGTHEQNSQDCLLHHKRPRYFREIEPDECEAIKADPRHPNVTAVVYQIPTALIYLVKSGVYRP